MSTNPPVATLPAAGYWRWMMGNRWMRRSVLPWLRRRTLMRRSSLSRPYHPVIMGRPLSHGEVGELGELLAARWLRRHRRKILRRNHRSTFGGELDIVARHGQVLTFVEVKTRTQAQSDSPFTHGRPADAVNPQKRRRIQKGAADWLRLLGRPRLIFRFDIVEVLLIPGYPPQVHLIENAFTMPDMDLSGR